MSLSSVSFNGAQARPAFGAQQKNQAQAQPAVNFGQGQAAQPQVRFGDGGLISGPLLGLGAILACCACCVGIIALPFIAGKKLIGGLVNKAKNLAPAGGK